MNSQPSHKPNRHSLAGTEHPSGMALVLVLACMVLISGLLVAFLTSVRTDLASSSGYAAGTNARLTAESALNLVIGQIQKATSTTGEVWTSQPGLIRTFKSDGSPATAYKLYSASQLESSGDVDPAADLPPASWKDEPNLYCDLNAPLQSGSSLIYPILDASSISSEGILDADADGQADIEGFSVTDPAYVVSAGRREIAMPVQWLYQLKDGTFAIASAAEGKEVSLKNLDGTAVPATNPPVARLAFWTDDESSKLNINTASEGTYWDTPVANTWPTAAGSDSKEVASSYTPDPRRTFELDLAAFQGAQHEFQRYAGHPATTSLWPVLAAALGTGTAYKEAAETIYQLTPRVKGAEPGGAADHSSQGGTAKSSKDLWDSALQRDTDRLYANVDEYLFRPDRTVNPFGADSKAFLGTAQFFLTASSRAPEVNLFGGPRVAAWPINTDTAKRTFYDKLIAFCATLEDSGTPAVYYTTRKNPLSSTEDFASRNLSLYNHLFSRMSTPVPGFSSLGNFSAKYDTDAPQILTEMFDYIRCLNLFDVSEDAAGATTHPLAYTLDQVDDPKVTPTVKRTLRGSVTPLAHPGNGTRGFGRFPTMSQFVVAAVRVKNPNGETPPQTSQGMSRVNSYIQLSFWPTMFYPAAGYTAPFNNFRIEISGLETITVTDSTGAEKSGFMPASHTLYSVGHNLSNTTGYQWDNRTGGSQGIGALWRNDLPYAMPATGGTLVAGTNTTNVSPWNGNARCKIKSGPITVRLITPFDDSVGPPEVVQQAIITFPETEVLLPYRDQWNGGGFVDPATGAKLNGRVAPFNALNSTLDSVRALVANTGNSSGDYRLLAGSHDVSAFFGKHPDYDKQVNGRPIRLAHSTKGGAVDGNSNYAQATFGDLITGIPSSSYQSYSRPDVPAGATGLNTAGEAGDWDNGPGLMSDGAYINKADEGLDYQHGGNKVPYIGDIYSLQDTETISPTRFSPNKQMPSPVMFGSLSTGVNRRLPWQTLLFRPARTYFPGGRLHPGSAAGGPPDHLLLDLFWVPVVEPYAISEPFSTAGKVNMNYQIAPFTYIQRKTGLYGLLRSVKIPALAHGALVNKYKTGGRGGATASDVSIRQEIDIPNTLKFFDERFSSTGANKPFLSASEICDVPLVPKGAAASDSDSTDGLETKLATFWDAHKLTGDNMLERPYAHIYPRVTTKSNTFTVHVYVQTLQKTKVLPADQFDAAKDVVTGEFQGSFVIERYLDPNKQTFNEADPGAVLGPYKCRVISSKQLSL